MMIRRLSWRKLFLGALCLVQAGCETHRSWLRPRDDDDIMSRAASSSDDSSPRKIIGSSPDDQDASSFFRSSRRSGGWSSEAREIESHFNAN